MAVETRYVVIRTGKSNEEQEVMTFTDKREADEHDKMLDMADALFEVIQESNIELSESQSEELSIYLAKKRESVLVALQAKKKSATTPTNKKIKTKNKSNEQQNDLLNEDECEISPKSLSETLLSSNANNNGIENENENENKNEQQSKTDNFTETKNDKLIDFVIEKDDAA